MKTHLLQLAEDIVARTPWIIDRWVGMVARNTEVKSADNLTFRQLMDHLPALCGDLGERLRRFGEEQPPDQERHAQLHGTTRWKQGYKLDEMIREAGLLRRVIAVECLDEFARDHPDFDAANRREAELIIHEFLDETVADSARQFASEQHRDRERSERNSQAILESALDSIIVMGEDGRVREWNQAAERMFGYSRSDALGAELASLVIPAELRDRHRAGLAKYLATGEGPLLRKRIEINALRADGSTFMVELAIAPHREGGRAVFTAYLRDITARLQQERRRGAQYTVATLVSGPEPLEEVAARLLETIGESGTWVSGALWLLNSDDDLTCHTTWRRSGRPETEFERDTRERVFARGAGLPGRVLASGRPRWVQDVAEEPQFPRAANAAASGLHSAFLFPLLCPDGVNGVVEMLSEEVLSSDEDLLHLAEALGIQIGLYIQRKKIEEELRRQKEAAETASQAKDRFLAALSHELRTPLNPVLMWACAAVEDRKLDAEFKEGLHMICRNVELEARLIDDLLDLTRINRGKLHLNFQPCQADELLEHALEIVRSQLTIRRLQISVDLQASNHNIMADSTRVQQVFWNLLKNAIKFTPEKGRIAVRSYDAAPGTVAFEISDTGPGMDPEVMPRLFTAFEQGRHTGEGLGLGLAICKAILDLHGATISAANQHGRAGAVFTIEFHTISGPVAPREPPAEKPPMTVPPRQLRILIVEDHDSTAAVMSKLLQRDGHQVTTAATVRDAMALLSDQQFDLLLSDLGLPDGNGFQVMRELSRVSNAKGIAVSGYGMDEDVARSSAAGFSAHLTKPVNVQELQETIQLVTGEW